VLAVKATQPIYRTCLLTNLSLIAMIGICGCGETVSLPGNAVQPARTKQQHAAARIQRLGGWVKFDGTNPDRPVVVVAPIQRQFTDAGLVHLRELTKLQELHLNHTEVTDAGLVHLKGLTELRRLGLMHTKVGDAGLVHLAGLTELVSLNLTSTEITDTGLVHLQGLTNLRFLYLDSPYCFKSEITDRGLVHLKGMT
jgi:hypothetical protein